MNSDFMHCRLLPYDRLGWHTRHHEVERPPSPASLFRANNCAPRTWRLQGMDKRHQGKTAVISGAASGIGQATAVRLAQEGANVIVADRAKADDTLARV